MPSPVLASLLEEIHDIDELKIILRTIWKLHSKKAGTWRSITQSELCADRTVAAMLQTEGIELEKRVSKALSAATSKGVFLVWKRSKDDEYLLNTEPNRRLVMRSSSPPKRQEPYAPETRQNLGPPPAEGLAIRAYEENIGEITPMVAESIRDSLAFHTEQEIASAIRTAVEANARNWSYVAAVLKRMRERRAHGKHGQHSAKTGDDFIREYRKKQKQRGNRLH